jgi:hypothetical protein
VKTNELHQEITTSHFLNPALRMPENKTFVILPAQWPAEKERQKAV